MIERRVRVIGDRAFVSDYEKVKIDLTVSGGLMIETIRIL